MNDYTVPGAATAGAGALAATGAGSGSQLVLFTGALLMVGALCFMLASARRRRADKAASRR